MIQFVLHTLFTIGLCSAAFVFGVRTADRYNRQKELAINHALERQRLDLKAGVTPWSPARPYISEHGEFAQRLTENGQATFLFPSGKHTAQ